MEAINKFNIIKTQSTEENTEIRLFENNLGFCIAVFDLDENKIAGPCRVFKELDRAEKYFEEEIKNA